MGSYTLHQGSSVEGRTSALLAGRLFSFLSLLWFLIYPAIFYSYLYVDQLDMVPENQFLAIFRKALRGDRAGLLTFTDERGLIIVNMVPN
jgi:hypothetical protein